MIACAAIAWPPRARLLLLLLLLAGTVPLGAQELPRAVGQRWVGVGRYHGTRHGTHTDTLYNGDIVQESTDCALTMTFNPDGTMHFDAGPYVYTKIYSKRTQNGYEKAVTRLQADGGTGDRNSRMTMVVTQYDEIWLANWQPIVEVPGSLTQETWFTDAHGRVLHKRLDSEEHPLVHCDVHVIWRGRDGKGPGLPMTGSQTRPDVIAKAPWITVSVDWSLRRNR